MKNNLLIICILSLSLLFNYIPASAQNIPDFLVNEQICVDGSEQETPDIAGDGNGNYVITWMDGRIEWNFDIYAQIYLSDGTTLGNNFKVNDDEGGTGSQYGPDIAVDPNLNFVITWIDKRSTWEWDIYAQRFSNDGTALGNNFIVNTDTADVEQEHPSVSIDSCGNFVIVWADKRSGEWDIYAQRFLYDGSTLGDNFIVNDDAGNAVQYWPTNSCNKNGNFIVAWVDVRYNDDYDIYAQRFLADGTAIGNNFKVNTDAGNSSQLCPDIAIKENGDFIITWGDKRNNNWDVYAQRYLSDGSPLGDNFLINDDMTISRQKNPSISTDLAGDFIVSWEHCYDENCDIYARRFTGDAVPLGNSFRVNSDTGNAYQYYSEIMEDKDGNFTITWQDHRLSWNGEIFAQSFLSDGTPQGDNFKVNDDVGAANQTNPSIAKDGSDNFIIAWVDHRNYNDDIYVQRFSNNGTIIDSNFIVNDDSGYSDQWSPSIAADLNGNFVITWTDYRIEYWGDIFAQRFSNEGTALGNNFKVNNISAWVNYGSKAVCKKNGDFIITWGDALDESLDNYSFQYLNDENIQNSDSITKNKGSEPDIYAQQYLSDGTPFGGNFKVNDDVGNTYQEFPNIAVDTNGNFIIVWNDNRNGDYDIYAQRYLSDGTPAGSNFKVEDSVFSEEQYGASISSDENGNFIISWMDKRNGNFDIYAQRYLNDGTPIGNNFQVNTDTGNTYQLYPCISARGNGDFIITWTDRRNGDKDVYAQRYLSNGMPLGNNYRVSNTGEMEQHDPQVILGNNRIYTTWQDKRGGQTKYDIWANVMNWENFAQEIFLCEGYQFASSNIDPAEPDMLDVLDELLNENLSFVRNSLGQTLRIIGPNWVNGIGDWIVNEGYLVKMFDGDSFTINGFFVDPTTPIPVVQGFQFVSYFPENPMDALFAFETIMDDNLDYIRNSNGQTLRKIGPIWVNGIGDCQPGEGYLVKMFADGEIIYPASEKSSGKTTITPTNFSFEGGNPADPVYTMYVNGLEIGDEVGAYDGNKMIGSVKINSQNAFENELPVFSTLINGVGYEGGNPIILRVWSENNIVSADFTMEQVYDSYVSDIYPDEDGKYSIVNITKGKIKNKDETISIYPNPSKGIFNISLEGIIGNIQIKVFDLRGKEYSNFKLNGSVSRQLDLSELSAGVYFISFRGENFSQVKKIVIK
jgi:hypothetical protein